jgi:hypothetical protein
MTSFKKKISLPIRAILQFLLYTKPVLQKTALKNSFSKVVMDIFSSFKKATRLVNFSNRCTLMYSPRMCIYLYVFTYYRYYTNCHIIKRVRYYCCFCD